TVLAARPDLQRHLIDDDDAANRQPTLYVPFAEPDHPFQGIVHQGLASEELLRKFGLGHLAEHDRTGWLELSWSARTEPRPENRVSFHSDQRDWCGMPAISVDFELSDEDRRSAELALDVLTTAANNLGRPVPGFEPRLCPPGTSLHYTGTVRMGPVPGDSASVCDPHSRVHGLSNLFVGGNGVIPLATTCNPTLTSIALAAHAIPAVLTAIS
ncbi:MAG TPA: GMC family oxidoreductase, partial [Mycobacteriales bacterium]|nr:GMC family oxidoreductase [Mycobacteriales bacterium]